MSRFAMPSMQEPFRDRACWWRARTGHRRGARAMPCSSLPTCRSTRWGRDVAAHAHGTEGIKAAIRAGVHTIDHGSGLDDEAIALLKSHPNTYSVPTLALMSVNIDEKRPNVFPPAEMER